MPAALAASSTGRVASRPPMLPGLMRSFAAPASAAAMAMRASKWMSATTGTGKAAHTSAKAGMQSMRGTAMRRISQPAAIRR